MIRVEDFVAARRAGIGKDHAAGRVGLVPTMGSFHEGHLSLMNEARKTCDTVIVSLFVNPLQFGHDEDLDRYPRDLDRDAAFAEEIGVDILFAPPLDEMYPDYPSTRVSVDALSISLEGRSRPGHFEGVATVVTKLFAGLRPDVTFFGRKDAQQLAVIRRLASDLSFPIEIVGLPIVRDTDGLALSSRNQYLSTAERRTAVGLSRGLMAAADAAEQGERAGVALEATVLAEIEGEAAVTPEYAELTDQADVIHLPKLDRPSFLAAAIRVGKTRLIDNVHFDWVLSDSATEPGTPMADRGVWLDQPSMGGLS